MPSVGMVLSSKRSKEPDTKELFPTMLMSIDGLYIRSSLIRNIHLGGSDIHDEMMQKHPKCSYIAIETYDDQVHYIDYSVHAYDETLDSFLYDLTNQFD